MKRVTTGNRSTTLILWPLVIVGLTYAFVLGGAFPGVFSPSFRLVDAVVAAISLGVWLIACIVRPAWRPRTALGPAVLVSLGAFVVATATSQLLRVSLEYLLYAVVLWALYLLLVRLQANSALGRRMGSIAVVVLLVVLGLYLRATISTWIVWWSLVGRPAVPPLRPGFESLAFGNPSALGAVTFLLFVTAAAQVNPRRTVEWLGVGALGVICLGVCVLTGARSVWLGVVSSAAAVVLLVLASRSRRVAVVQKIKTRVGGVVAVIGIVVVAILGVVAGPGILVRAGFGDPFRPGYWLASLRMLADDPLTGQGLGLWPIERATFTTSADLDFYIPHAHNVYLQALAEMGLVSAIAAAFMVVVTLRLIRRSLNGSSEQRRFGWAATAGLAYLAGHQTVDVVTNLPAILLAVALPLSRLDALDQTTGNHSESEGDDVRARWRASTSVVAIPLGAVLAACILAWWTSIAVTNDEGVAAANAGNWGETVARAERAVDLDPDIPAYRVTLGLARAETGAASEAVHELRASATIDDWPQAWLNVAALEASAGRTRLAFEALDRALRLGIQQPSVALQAAVLYADLGDQQRAARSLTEAFRRAPSIAGDIWWDSRPKLQQARASAIDLVIAEGGPSAVRLALEVDRLDDIKSVLSERDSAASRLAVAAWTGDVAAGNELRLEAERRPLDLEVVGWNAILADHFGDVPARNRYRLWADLINGGAGSEAVGYRIVPVLPRGAVPVGTFGLSYGLYLYLRPVPTNQIPAGLPQLVYR